MGLIRTGGDQDDEQESARENNAPKKGLTFAIVVQFSSGPCGGKPDHQQTERVRQKSDDLRGRHIQGRHKRLVEERKAGQKRPYRERQDDDNEIRADPAPRCCHMRGSRDLCLSVSKGQGLSMKRWIDAGIEKKWNSYSLTPASAGLGRGPSGRGSGFAEGIEQFFGHLQLSSPDADFNIRLGDAMKIASAGYQQVALFG